MNPLVIVSLATSLTAHAPVTTSHTTPVNDPGTCRCNSGCHHFADQCTHENDCAPGYVPYCSIRDTDDPTCPWDPSVTCDGECQCVPYVGGDGGLQGGSSSSGGGWSSSGSGGSSSGSGSSSGGTSSSGSGSGGASSSSGGVSSSSGSGGSSSSGGDPDAGCDCPAGDLCIGDNFCANPCPSDGSCQQGYECSEGYCVPVCFLIPCPSPSYCDPATGQCVDVSDGGVITGHPGFPDAGSSSGGSSSGGASSGGSSSGSSGSSSGAGKWHDAGSDASNGTGPVGDDHGCGCRAAGTDATTRGFGVIALAALGLMARRRRR